VVSDPQPKISVVLPTYNRSNLVRESAASVLRQSYRDLELLIVDDGSSEDVAAALTAILQAPRARIVRHETNKGVAAARNSGASLARGTLIAFLDSDDIWYDNKLSSQLDWMAMTGRPVSCTGYRIVTPFRPEGEERLPQEMTLRQLRWGCRSSPGSTMVVSKALFEAVGGFDTSLRRLEDWEWLLRCAETAPIGIVPEILAFVRGGARETYPWKDARESAATIERYVLSGRYRLSRREGRVLRSTLHGEVAAAAYRQRRYGSAVASLLKSLYYHPLKRLDYYRRITRAVIGDLRGQLS
jgi:glycosyltransferase involved in cell wall biosynthesis